MTHDCEQARRHAEEQADEMLSHLVSAERPVSGARIPECVEAWPECEDGAYDPRCCRFPKSCSCGVERPVSGR